MERIRSTQVHEHIGERVILAGWLHQLRALGKINFVLVRDGYGVAQAMTQDANALAAPHNLQNETVIQVEGTVVAEPQAPRGIELHDISVCVVTPVIETLPFSINKLVAAATLPSPKSVSALYACGYRRALRSPRCRLSRAAPAN